MRTPVLALLLLLPACARDLDLPPAPGDEPERLGALSGVYGMSIFGTVEGVAEPMEIPVQATLLVVHLDKPQGEVQPLLALIDDQILDLEPSFNTTPEDDPGLTFSRIFAGGFDGKNLAVQGLGTLSMTGEEAPGATGLTLHANDLTVCPRSVARSRGGPTDLHARRLCDFDPAISGVYRGTAASCDGRNSKASYMGLGIFNGGAVGLRYPEDGEILLGSYNRFTGQGVGLVGSLQGTGGLSSFQLSDKDQKLHLDMTVTDATGQNCSEVRSMDFLGTPGVGVSCSPNGVVNPELGFEALAHVSGGARFLDVRLFPASDPFLTVDPGALGLEVFLNDAASDTPVNAVRPDQVPSGYTARFPLDPPGFTPRYYEIFALRIFGSQGVAQVAPVACLRDRSR